MIDRPKVSTPMLAAFAVLFLAVPLAAQEPHGVQKDRVESKEEFTVEGLEAFDPRTPREIDVVALLDAVYEPLVNGMELVLAESDPMMAMILRGARPHLDEMYRRARPYLKENNAEISARLLTLIDGAKGSIGTLQDGGSWQETGRSLEKSFREFVADPKGERNRRREELLGHLDVWFDTLTDPAQWRLAPVEPDTTQELLDGFEARATEGWNQLKDAFSGFLDRREGR